MSTAAILLGTGALTSNRALAEPYFGDNPWKLGVASGDPLPDGVVLWTRLAPEPLAEDGSGGMKNETYGVRYEVAEDENFKRIVKRGAAEATPVLGHSVHPEIKGLKAGREYFYRFKAGPEVRRKRQSLLAHRRAEVAGRLHRVAYEKVKQTERREEKLCLRMVTTSPS
jgi:phosphodiesterase/alkaline phosphatase D-like protein